jgi:hypothetical protein
MKAEYLAPDGVSFSVLGGMPALSEEEEAKKQKLVERSAKAGTNRFLMRKRSDC